jgi:SAM-dependent methyltransferase
MATAPNYNAWIYSQVRPVMGQRILDVGCGSANITQMYHDRELIVGLDVEEEHLAICRKKLEGKNQFQFLRLDVGKEDVSPLKQYRFDTITCLNVLEHIENDVEVLQKFNWLLEPGGHLVLLVPAMRFLFGSMDATDGHFRRYQKPDLRPKIETAGFEVKRLFYMNFPGVFGWFLNARLLRRKFIPDKQLRVYDNLVPFFRSIESFAPPPIGQSLICWAQKPA